MALDIKPLITKYSHLINKLRTTVGSNSPEQFDTAEDGFIVLLQSRDELAELLKDNSISNSKLFLEIKAADKELFNTGTAYIVHHSINVPTLRAVAKHKNEALGWWWYLDDNEVEHGGFTTHWYNLRPVLWTGLALFLLLFSLQLTINTSIRIATFIVQLFPNIESIDLSFDTLTLLGFLAQIFIGGRIVMPFTRRIADDINRGIYTLLGFTHFQMLRHMLPLSRFLVGTLLFIFVIWICDAFIVVRLADALREQARSSIDAHSLSRTEGSLEASALLNPDNYYAIDLVILGQRYEDMGDNENALRLYENALSADPQLLLARYWLSNMYVYDEQYVRAIEILDYGLRQIHQETNYYRNGTAAEDDFKPTLPSLESTIQVRYLFLINRARAFLALDLPNGAIQDLIVARELTLHSDYQHFFITSANKDVPPENAIKALDLYYYSARTYTALYDLRGDERYLQEANEAWRMVRQLADVNTGVERLWLIEAQP
jgi:tetratricopeptide (TPR) repeat protein